MPALLLVVATGAISLPAHPSAHARNLTFQERVKAQEAIELVYYSHQIGATKSFEEAVSREVLAKKVRTYLKESVALEKLWNTPVTGAALQAELERIASSTRLPERLQEVYRALGDDPVLIAESLARPVLVDRLARSFFAFDQRIHAAPRKEAEDLRGRLLGAVLDPSAEHPNRQVLELVRRDPPQRPDGGSPATLEGHTGAGPSAGRLELAPEEFERWRARAPKRVGDIGPVSEESDAFVVRVVLEGTEDRARLAVFTIPKVPWEKWWKEVADALDEDVITAAAAPSVRLPALAPRGEQGLEASKRIIAFDADMSPAFPTCIPDNTWDNGILDDMLRPRAGHTAVWTGTLMIVWGGSTEEGVTSIQNAGARYDPLTDTWAATSAVNAPAVRTRHSAIWTGAAMVVWGGVGGSSILNTGGRYDPSSDSWQATSTVGAPEGRLLHKAVWTGKEMIVWGGTRSNTVLLNGGGRYDPATDSWAATAAMGAPFPRLGHTATWTGSEMIVWGGLDTSFRTTNTGGRYDPVADTWTPISTTGAPIQRSDHSAVWTGSRLIVWGGAREFAYDQNTGGSYDPVSDTWTATSRTEAPSRRSFHTAVWTGREMIVWGGYESSYDLSQALDTGGRYDPASDSWASTSTMNAPAARSAHTAVWTGSQMIVWGGLSHYNGWLGGVHAVFNSGGRYDAAGDSWTPTSALGAPPGVLCCHSAVWTGNLMIVWGGMGETETPVNAGARYDLMTDTWTPTSLSNAPAARMYHQAIWTGNEMIVWGGLAMSSVLNDGSRYDPVSDSWRPISTTGAPSPRLPITPAVWTGSEMIVWGGLVAGNTTTSTGGRYSAATDSWRATSTTDAPSPRWGHTAVWTGSEMLVWGGAAPFQGSFNTGGRYDPASDSWSPVSLTGAPSRRHGHEAVWTGSLMIVLGGITTFDRTGGRYDPATDTWTPTSTIDAPGFRAGFTALWTGKRMIVSSDDGSGGLYDPTADSWALISTINAPSYRGLIISANHTAVWTDGFMIVWARSWGGRYALEQAVDNDGDGHSDCGGDCDDSDAAIHPGAVDMPGDARDDDCSGAPACDPSADWLNHGQFVRCVANECDRLVAAGLVSREACDGIVRDASRSVSRGVAQPSQPGR